MLPLYGWEYKHRGPRPKFLPPVVPTAIQAELNDALPAGITVTAVVLNGNYISLSIYIMEESA